MALESQMIINNNPINNSYSEHDAFHALYTELEKGVQSMKNGEVYTRRQWEQRAVPLQQHGKSAGAHRPVRGKGDLSL